MQAIGAFVGGMVTLVLSWFPVPVQHPPTKMLETSDIFPDLAAVADATTTEALLEATSSGISSDVDAASTSGVTSAFGE